MILMKNIPWVHEFEIMAQTSGGVLESCGMVRRWDLTGGKKFLRDGS